MEVGPSNELQILREKKQAFCGAFKIPLNKLKLEQTPENPRQIDAKNVTNILERFHLEKCNRLEPERYVSALISRAESPHNLRPHTDPFEEPQHFNPPQALLCLDGEHRLEAANRFLAGEDRWWVANLYFDDISVGAKTALREQESGSASYFDGDIYRQIRIAALDQGISSDDRFARRNKWLARLSAEKRRNVTRMESSLAMRGVRDGLDALVPFTGLWPALEIGHFKRLLDIHCPEEMARYLHRIKQTWTHIVGDREDHQNKLDANTVRMLQGRCPFRSLSDRTYIETMLLNEELLQGVGSSNLPKTLLQRVMSVEHTIPSIHTFLEGVKWLEPASTTLKSILPTKCTGSLAQAFRALHNGQTKVKEQTSAFSYRWKNLPTRSEAECLSYRQLWLIPLRHYPTPKKDGAKWKGGKVTGKRKRNEESREIETTKPVGHGLGQQWQCQLASLASTNGYQQIKHTGSADADAAKDFLLKVRPPRYYNLEGSRMGQKMQLIRHVLDDIEAIKTQTACPEMTSDYDDCGSDIEDRCGRPQEHSVKKDEENLFIGHVYPESLTMTPQKYMTSFACKRDSFHFFFGSPENGSKHRRESDNDPNGHDEVSVGAATHSRGKDDSLADLEERNEGTVVDISRGVKETRSHPTDSTLTSRGQENRMQLTRVDSTPSAPAVTGAVESTDEGAGPVGQNETIPTVQASRLLLKGYTSANDHAFTVLSPTEDGRFRTRHANPNDKSAIVAVLRLISGSHFMTSASGERLRLTDPRTVVEEAHSGRLKTVLTLPRKGVQELVRQFESSLRS